MFIQKTGIISLVKSLKLDDEIKNKKIIVVQRQNIKKQKNWLMEVDTMLCGRKCLAPLEEQ